MVHDRKKILSDAVIWEKDLFGSNTSTSLRRSQTLLQIYEAAKFSCHIILAISPDYGMHGERILNSFG